MAKPTPVPTAQRALATAIKALESISISTGIKGTAVKLGSEIVTDVSSVVNDLQAVKADAEEFVTGLQLMLNKLGETKVSPSEAIPSSFNNSESSDESVVISETEDIPALKEHLEYAFSSTVPERMPAPELFSATPEF